jgi:hypothetical protein
VDPEHICEVRSAGKDYVIRAELRGAPLVSIPGVSLDEWIGMASELWRGVRHLASMGKSPKPQETAAETGWIVQVRARTDDPFGKVLYEENAAAFPEARDRAEALARELRSGNRLWEQPEDSLRVGEPARSTPSRCLAQHGVGNPHSSTAGFPVSFATMWPRDHLAGAVPDSWRAF